MTTFSYGEKETSYLKQKDKVLGSAIDAIGQVERAVEPDLFTALVFAIISQQISTRAQQTVCRRMREALGEVTPETVSRCTAAEIQRFGMTFKKAENIKAATERVQSGLLDLDALTSQTDERVCRELSALPGVGIWTAEMLMIFSMQRPDVFSYGDLAIHRGLRMLYRHRKITKELFEKYRRRYSPYGSVASLYLWAIAGGAVPELRDPAAKERKTK